jgi:hypothetical protein
MLTWLGQASDTSATAAAWESYVRALRDDVNVSFSRASRAREALKRVRERLGLPFMAEQSGEGQVPLGAWAADLEQQFLELGSMVATLTRFADDAIEGRRRLGFDAQGGLALERLDSDATRVEIRGGRPIEIENATGEPVRVTGTVSALPPIVLGVIVVAAAVATYFAVAEVCDTVEKVAVQKQIETVKVEQTKQLQAGATPEQVKALTDSIYDGAATVHQAQAAESTAGKSEIPQTIRTVGFIALGLAALYIVAQFVGRRGGVGGALAPARLLENPVRRSGDVKVNVRYRDAEDDYAGTVSWPGGSWRFEQLRPSPFWQQTHAADSSETYDEVSRAALSFGADENEEIYAHADTDERGEFVVRRR